MRSHESPSPLDRLRSRLANLKPGPIDVDSQLASDLASSWDALIGSDQESMTADKVGRLENLKWNPPLLSFDIERHGSTVRGSSRAEVHTWTVDVMAATADVTTGGFRQIKPRAAPWDANNGVEVVLEAVREHRDEPYLKWKGDDFRVLTGNIIPPGPKQTTAGRSKRFRTLLADRLTTNGWQQQGQYWTRITDEPGTTRRPQNIG